MYVLKNSYASELTEANYHARLGHSIQLLKKYSCNNVNIIILVHWWSDIHHSGDSEKPTWWPTVSRAATKKKGVTTKCLCTPLMFSQLLITSVGESQMVDNAPVWNSLILWSWTWPSVLWRCCLDIRKSIQPVKLEWWGAGVVICLERGVNDLHMVQLMLRSPYHLLLR